MMQEKKLRWTAIGMGANLPSRAGSPAETLCAAAEELSALGAGLRLSSLYRTRPVSVVTQPEFVNAAAVLRTTLEPEALLLKLLAIERKFGREREFCIPNGPRTLDLDLLLMEGVVCSSTRLVLPHLRLHNRRFVLMPLAEIAPDLLHTTRKESMAELLRKLPVEEGDVVRIG